MSSVTEPVTDLVRASILQMSGETSPATAVQVALAVIGGAVDAIREIEPVSPAREAQIVAVLAPPAPHLS